MADNQVFDDTFSITSINAEKYDRVSRIYGTSTTDQSTTMSLDINHELFPVSVGDNVNILLAQTLNLGNSDKEEKGWREVTKGDSTLADLYEYVCHGKSYRFEMGEGDMSKFYASFGGLLLYIEAPSKKLSGLKIEQVYMLCKK